MKYALFSLMLLSGMTLVGCATTHQPKTFNELGQFASYPLNNQTYRISFKADSNMSYGTAEEITLVKAAQTALKNGFNFFKVAEDPSNQTQKPPRQAVVYSSPHYYPYGYYRRYPGFWPDPFYNMPQVVNIDPTEVSYTITCYKNHSTAPNDAFDSRLILQSIGQKYGLSPTGEVILPQTEPTKANRHNKN